MQGCDGRDIDRSAPPSSSNTFRTIVLETSTFRTIALDVDRHAWATMLPPRSKLFLAMASLVGLATAVVLAAPPDRRLNRVEDQPLDGIQILIRSAGHETEAADPATVFGLNDRSPTSISNSNAGDHAKSKKRFDHARLRQKAMVLVKRGSVAAHIHVAKDFGFGSGAPPGPWGGGYVPDSTISKKKKKYKTKKPGKDKTTGDGSTTSSQDKSPPSDPSDEGSNSTTTSHPDSNSTTTTKPSSAKPGTDNTTTTSTPASNTTSEDDTYSESTSNTTGSPSTTSGCTFSSVSSLMSGKKSCRHIVLNSIEVPAGETLDLGGLTPGTEVTFAGTTTFGYKEWAVSWRCARPPSVASSLTFSSRAQGPLISIINSNSISVTGAKGHILSFEGERWWDGWGGLGGKKKPRAVFVAKLDNSSISGLRLKNTPIQGFSLSWSTGLGFYGNVIDNYEGVMGGKGHNNDGFNIGRCTDCRVIGNTVDSTDDCVAINSGQSIKILQNNCIQ